MLIVLSLNSKNSAGTSYSCIMAKDLPEAEELAKSMAESRNEDIYIFTPIYKATPGVPTPATIERYRASI